MKIKNSTYQVAIENLNEPDSLKSKVISYSLRKGMGVTTTKFVYDIAQQGDYTQLPDNIFNILMYHELIVPDEEEELIEKLQQNQLRASDIDDSEITFVINTNAIDEQHFSQLKNVINTKFIDQNRHITKKLQLQFTDQSISCLFEQLPAVEQQLTALPIPSYIKQEHRLICHRLGGSSNQLLEKITNTDLFFREAKLIINTSYLTEEELSEELYQLKILLSQSLTDVIAQWELILLLPPKLTKQIGLLAGTLSDIKNKALLRVHLIHDFETDTPALIEEREQQLLLALADANLPINLLPGPTYQLSNSHAAGRNGMVVADPLLDIIALDDQFHLSVKALPDSHWIEKLKNHQSPCSSCQYLFICGGNKAKQQKGDGQCPDFIYQFKNRVRLKYNMPLRQNMTHEPG